MKLTLTTPVPSGPKRVICTRCRKRELLGEAWVCDEGQHYCPRCAWALAGRKDDLPEELPVELTGDFD